MTQLNRIKIDLQHTHDYTSRFVDPFSYFLDIEVYEKSVVITFYNIAKELLSAKICKIVTQPRQIMARTADNCCVVNVDRFGVTVVNVENNRKSKHNFLKYFEENDGKA